MDINKRIGNELIRVRTSIGWTRSDLVEQVSPRMPVNTYACYEQGIRACSIVQLHKICQALKVPTSLVVATALDESTKLKFEVDIASLYKYRS